MPDVLIGRTAPEFELPTAAGEMLRLSDCFGRGLLLVFHRHLM